MKIWFERPVSVAVKKLLHAEALFAQAWALQNRVQDPIHGILFCSQLSYLLAELEQTKLVELLERRLIGDNYRLQQWEGVMGVDAYRIACLEREIKETLEALSAAKSEIAACQAEWPLCALQQAYLQKPGRVVAHENPDVMYWLQLAGEQRQLSVQGWMKRLMPIKQALTMHLRLLRELSSSQVLKLDQPFGYVSLAVGTEFIRISFDKQFELIPQIFVQALRCMIRFTHPADEPDVWTPMEIEFRML